MPSASQVAAGLSPQLTLEAAIIANGGFDALGPRVPEELLYLRLSGNAVAGEEKRIAPGKQGSAEDLARDALEGFTTLAGAYDDPGLAYRPRAVARLTRAEEPFDHLSRFREWSTAEGNGEGNGEGGE